MHTNTRRASTSWAPCLKYQPKSSTSQTHNTVAEDWATKVPYQTTSTTRLQRKDKKYLVKRTSIRLKSWAKFTNNESSSKQLASEISLSQIRGLASRCAQVWIPGVSCKITSKKAWQYRHIWTKTTIWSEKEDRQGQPQPSERNPHASMRIQGTIIRQECHQICIYKPILYLKAFKPSPRQSAITSWEMDLEMMDHKTWP